uniref:2-oxoglutarate dehydrogenase, E2 component, dihydrolipoamide succinyltransferase n=1 Tax=Mycobacterium avium TaxID=1764 RepID=UPI0007A01A41
QPAQAQPAQAQPAAGGEGTPYVTPLVRKLAAENNIDLSSITGTGVGGRIRKQDVLAAAEQKQRQQQAAAQPSAAPAPAAAEARQPAAPTPAPALAHLRGTTHEASRNRPTTAAKTPQPQAQPAPQPQPQPQAQPAPEPKAQPAQAQPAQAQPAAGGEGTPYVTPLVRKLAAENNIDLSSITGTGVGGRIRKQDVLAAAEQKQRQQQAAAQPSAAPAPAAAEARKPAAPTPAPALAHLRGTTQKASRIRQITAAKTRESLLATAQLTQTHEVDMTRLVGLRARAKAAFAEREGVNLTFLPFIARAVIDALKIHPNINASYNEETKEITYYDAEHLGFAVDTEQGLLSPVVHNAGDLSLAGLARAIADIAARARSGNLKPDELSGGTFTITNIGSQGALFDTPILVPPQAAMLGTGAIVKRPRVIVDEFGNESIGVRSVCYLPLTYDHRLIDGADAGRFLTTIKHRLEEGAFEADLGL